MDRNDDDPEGHIDWSDRHARQRHDLAGRLLVRHQLRRRLADADHPLSSMDRRGLEAWLALVEQQITDLRGQGVELLPCDERELRAHGIEP